MSKVPYRHHASSDDIADASHVLVPVTRVEAHGQAFDEAASVKNLLFGTLQRLSPIERQEIASLLLASCVQTDGTVHFTATSGEKRILTTDV